MKPTARCSRCGCDMHISPTGQTWSDVRAMYLATLKLDVPEPTCGQCVVESLCAGRLHRPTGGTHHAH